MNHFNTGFKPQKAAKKCGLSKLATDLRKVTDLKNIGSSFFKFKFVQSETSGE